MTSARQMKTMLSDMLVQAFGRTVCNDQRTCRAVVPHLRDGGGKQRKTMLSDMLDQNFGRIALVEDQRACRAVAS